MATALFGTGVGESETGFRMTVSTNLLDECLRYRQWRRDIPHQPIGADDSEEVRPGFAACAGATEAMVVRDARMTTILVFGGIHRSPRLTAP